VGLVVKALGGDCGQFDGVHIGVSNVSLSVGCADWRLPVDALYTLNRLGAFNSGWN